MTLFLVGLGLVVAGYFIGKLHLAFQLFRDLSNHQVLGQTSKLVYNFAQGVRNSVEHLEKRVKQQ